MKILINTIGKKNINDLLKFDIIVPIEFKKGQYRYLFEYFDILPKVDLLSKLILL